ncbi:hypothetical protein [Paenibacillus sp. y28]|uniref:hypothetical protein n=1 Tax=Paenibacillus sp. y28 TaxID=3129110 RepID=UPI00301A893B
MNKHQVQSKSSTGAKSAANAERGRQRTSSQSQFPAGAAQLLQLQKAAGNRAVAGMLQASAQSGQPVAQRALRKFRPKGDPKPELDTLVSMANKLDDLTMEAHGKVISALKAGDPSKVKDEGVSEGHYSNWLTNCGPMSTGYVIEDMVTSKVKGVQGYASQVTYGNARPDFVITDDKYSGVVDITTAKEAGHVLDKDFNINSFDYVSESLYPSINFDDIDKSFTFSEEDKQIIANAQKLKGQAKLGKMMSRVKGQLDLRIEQGFIDREMAQLASDAREIMKSLDLSNSEAVTNADNAIKKVNSRAKTVDSKSIDIGLVSDIITFINNRYFGD